MRLTVRRKLLLLLAGTLTATLLLVAVALTVLIGKQHAASAGQATHALLYDIGTQIAEKQQRLANHATTLAGREEIVASLALLTDYASPENYQPLIYDEEKKKLARELLESMTLLAEIVIYDGRGQLAALGVRHADGTSRAFISTWENGQYRPLGTAADAERWLPTELPAGLPLQTATTDFPAARVEHLRRVGKHLFIEVLMPVNRLRGSEIHRVGWLRMALPLTTGDFDLLAHPRNLSVRLLFKADFDADNAYGLHPEDFQNAPLLANLAREHPSDEESFSQHDFLHTAALPLANGETAWLVAILDRKLAQKDQNRAQAVVFATLIASLLVAMPLAGWGARRWIGTPLETLRAGVHTYTKGELEGPIALYSGDEFADLAEDFNLLAVTLRVREIAIQEAMEALQESEAHYRSFFAEAKAVMLLVDPADSRIIDANPAATAFYGYTRDELLARHITDINQLTPAQVEAEMMRALQENREHFIFQHRLKNGLIRTVEVYSGPYHDNNRLVLYSIIHDITERVEAERGIREAAAVFDATTEAIMITDTQGVIKRVNPAFTSICGYTAAEAVGQKPSILQSGRHEAAYYTDMWNKLLVEGRWEGEVWNRRKNGEIFPVWQIISSIRDGDGHTVEYVSIAIDITQRKRSEAEISYRANYDALTGLPNRTLLAERLGQALKQARRENSHVAVMFLDLDFFKQVNDTLGHATGDRLLQAVAERMRLCVRETDTIARQGGDEFVVLLADIEDASTASTVAEKIIGQLMAAFELDSHEIHIGASIGITLFPDDGRDIETLFRNADLAMYRAKEAGRNNAQFFEMAMTTAAIERRSLEADLRGALTRDEFTLHYQPVINLASGAIIGAEALLRWRHPRRGLVNPDQFIPLAEETGLIRDIGTWVFAEGCRQLAAWQAAGHSLTLAINVSVRQLPDALSVTHILTALARHQLAPDQIVLEITEGVLLADSPAIQEWFIAAGAAGLKLAIDDFGTGYSSLAYLKRFPVHHVKIDKGFIRDMASDPADRALVEAILAMAHSLGLSVVAEGVETAEQANLLRARNCELAQGYLYSRPVLEADFRSLLATQTAP